MAKKIGKDPALNAATDGSYSQLSTPLSAPKAGPDPQGALDNGIIPFASSDSTEDPMGFLDLTGDRGRRGDPKR